MCPVLDNIINVSHGDDTNRKPIFVVLGNPKDSHIHVDSYSPTGVLPIKTEP